MSDKTLIEILPPHLKPGLTPAEKILLEVAPTGGEADRRTGKEGEDNPEHPDNWGPERTIRADFLYWICTDPEAVKRVHAQGVKIRGAKIAGPLDFSHATLPHPLAISESAFEELTLDYAPTRALAFSGSSIHSFSADGLIVKGDLFLRKVKCQGRVRLLGADIGGNLECDKATFENPNGKAFSADGLVVKGDLFLKEVKCQGEVRLVGADIGGVLTCENATFENPGGKAFNANGLLVKENMFLREGKYKGEVQLLGADIGGQLNCNKATFENPNGNAFSADGLVVKGNLFLNEVKAQGEVRLLGADIGGVLTCEKSTFENQGGNAFSAENLKVAGVLFFTMEKTASRIILAHAKVGVLDDRAESWPAQGDLSLDGFEYKAFAPGSPQTAEERLKWVRLQPIKFYSFQPYEQLAKVFRNAGRDTDVREVLIAKQDDLRRYGQMSQWSKAWSWFMGFAFGYGYKPKNALVGFAFIFLLGAAVFYGAERLQIMQPSRERVYLDAEYRNTPTPTWPSRYPLFSPLIYSIDVAVPFLNLHQADYWLPDASRPYGRWFRYFFWGYITVGWFYSTLAALSLSGLIRKE